MIPYVVKQWEENKHKLEEYFSTTDQDEYSDYESIVRKLFELCITKSRYGSKWDLSNMSVVSNNHYTGTLVFILHPKLPDLDISDFIMTHTDYGTCSGCDVLEGIRSYGRGLPSESQVKQYMTLALHLVQKIKILG